MNENEKSCASTDQPWNTWDSINWLKCEMAVKKLQARIVKAQKEGKHGKVKSLQWVLTHSFYAKALAVKRVTSNNGKKTSGIDHVIWETPRAKYQAITTLKRNGYKPQPLKRVCIKKKNGKLRPLGIPTMKDRAMQALYLMALEPVAETTADLNSYGFRKARCTNDVQQKCHIALSRGNSAEWILEGDIKGCFDHISHEWLLNNIPMDKSMLRKWLKSGFIFNRELFPTEEGTPQGGIISPVLANMALDGLEAILIKRFKPYRKMRINGELCHSKVNYVRYADDFIITGRSKELLENDVIPIVREFLQERGLVLSEEKTKITHIDEGFDFLGFNIRKYKGTLLIKPTKESLKRFLSKLKYILDSNKSVKQESVIRLMNPVIKGWTNYYRYCCAGETFSKADYLIHQKMWRWAARRHPKKGRKWIAKRYFSQIENQKWCFSVGFNKRNPESRITLIKLSNTNIERYTKIKREANPFDPEWKEYFETRETNKMLSNLKGRKTLLQLWEKQGRKCPVCGSAIDKESKWSMSEKLQSGRKIKILIHSKCRNRSKRDNRGFEPASI